MVEPLCMCATILHFGYEMLLNSPCFESLELFWETVETLGAGVLAERHRSPGISPWRLHPVSSAPPPARLMTPAFCLPWGDVPILPYNGLNTESCELKRRILPKLLLGIQSQGWEKQYSVNINAMYVWKYSLPMFALHSWLLPGGPETLLVEMHAHPRRKTSTAAPCTGEPLHPLLWDDPKHTLSPEWPGLFCDKKLGSYAPLQNSTQVSYSP